MFNNTLISDTITYADSTPRSIILQLKERKKETKETFENKRIVFQNIYNSQEQIYNQALERWNKYQKDFYFGMDSLNYHTSSELDKLQKKIIRFRILEEHSAEVCVNAYNKAVDYFKEDKQIEENDEIANQISRDLIKGNLGIFPSDEIDEWFNFCSKNLRKYTPP